MYTYILINYNFLLFIQIILNNEDNKQCELIYNNTSIKGK